MRAFLTIILLSICTLISAQELHSKNKKAIGFYKAAQSALKIGNLGGALSSLDQALQKDESFDEAILLAHQVALLRNNIERSNQIKTEFGQGLAPEFINRFHSDQAHYHYNQGRYDLAEQAFAKVNGQVFGVSQDDIDRMTVSIDTASYYYKNPTNIEFETLPGPINKFGLQYFPSITANQNLIFTIRDQASRGDENLYESYLLEDGNWSEPMSISNLINTDRNEGTASVSADGRTLVFTSCNRPNNVGSCDLYVSYKQNQTWSKPELLEKVNSPEWDSQPSLSTDGTLLFFVSRRAGGLGEQDIWRSRLSENGWGEAENLGPIVNTAYDESSPFIFYDNSQLIYATKGRPGMGGFDLYVTKEVNGNWTEPKNLGYPINDSFDQIGYSVSVDNWTYYSSSDSEGGILLKRFKLPEEIVVNTLEWVSGWIKDDKTGESLNGQMFLLNEERIVLSENQVDSPGKRFSFPLNKANAFARAKAYGYYARTIKLDTLSESKEIEIRLQPIGINESVLIDGLKFDFGSSEIKDSEIGKLQPAMDYLLSNPEVIIEIGGHTDDVGSENDNLDLSKSRAESVYRYFISNGVAKENLVIKGYGKGIPLTPEKDEISRAKNRRIELKVKGFLEKE